MLLSKEQINRHTPEMADLYRTHLEEELVPGLIHFGVFDQTLAGEVIKAIAAIKNYGGQWFLWGCVVKPDYRGQELQKQLVNERLEYLKSRTDNARVYIEPWNSASIANLQAAGFEYQGQTIHEDGETIMSVYRLEWKRD